MSVVFIRLLLLTLLSSLDFITSDFLSVIYLFDEFNYFVPRELFTDIYRFIYNKLRLVKAYIKNVV
jgi:hypothetical protein